MKLQTMVAAAIFIAVMGGIYAISYVLNHKTPKPPGCEHLKPQCKGCHDTHCINHPNYQR